MIQVRGVGAEAEELKQKKSWITGESREREGGGDKVEGIKVNIRVKTPDEGWRKKVQGNIKVKEENMACHEGEKDKVKGKKK